MPEPLITVLLPVRDFNPYTGLAISSVLAQTHRNVELVIVGKHDVKEQLGEITQDSRVRGVARKGTGIVSALNTGLSHCSGDYIARMDADDICEPERLSTQLAMAMKQGGNCLIGASVSIFNDENNVGAGNQKYQSWLNSLRRPEEIHHACFIESPLPHPTWFAHRDFWFAMSDKHTQHDSSEHDNNSSGVARIYRDTGWPEDYDLILRSWLAGIPMLKPEPVLLHWRDHEDRLTRTDARYSREAFVKAKAWALCQPKAGFGVDGGRGIWLCGTGRNARYWHDALVENKATVLGFVELDNAPKKTQKRHLPVITYTELIQCRRDSLLVSSIGNPEARNALNNWLVDKGLHSGSDYILGN